ncbi:amidohydrolase family protein [Pseudonocardia sp. TRM90224]|uniref:amidohydrolase family protein n=1 Tax=Pseudonocardia sp. TRM90224 TaxID=2812678 RepID=UPI001E2EA0A9|nr:amidohydrolase family protein [Pseudonocardia sp. TRM90224]
MRTLIRNVRLFDGERVVPDADVLVDGDRIAEPDGDPADVEIDATGRTLLPGLIDAHTHVFAGSLEQALVNGVTTQLDMFCLPANLAVQRKLAAERADVADIRSAGTLATAPGGHPGQLMESLDGSAFGDAVGAFDSVAGLHDVERFVDARVAEEVDYLKIVIDRGHTADRTLPTLSAEIVTALVGAAHERGLHTIAHAITAEEAAVALDAGIDALAHVWRDAAPGDDVSAELAGWAAQREVAVVTTLVYFETIGGLEGATQAVRELHGAGAQLVAGTDANPYAPAHGLGMHRELQLLAQAGLTELEALAAATSVPARCFGLPDRGRIAPGLRADLLLVDGDPTNDINAISSIVDVWRGGVRRR